MQTGKISTKPIIGEGYKYLETDHKQNGGDLSGEIFGLVPKPAADVSISLIVVPGLSMRMRNGP